MKLAWGTANTQSGPQARRVAITGLGVVSCVGLGKEAFWNGLNGPAPEGFRQVKDFDPSEWFNPKEARRVDRFTQFNVAAGQGLEPQYHPPEGCVLPLDEPAMTRYRSTASLRRYAISHVYSTLPAALPP